MIKLINVLLLVGLVYAKTPFTIISSTSQVHHAGIQEAGSTIEYRVLLTVHKGSEQLEFLNCMVDSIKMPISILNAERKLTKTFNAGDTIRLATGMHFSPEKMHMLDKTVKQKLLINYSLKGKDYNVLVTPERKETVAHP